MSCLPHRFFGRISSRRCVTPVRHFAQSNAQLLDSSDKLEEETLPWYSQDRFYPMKIGETFQSRYQVVGKLGFGGYSTVWLSRDLQQHKYVTLKVFERDSSEGKRESEAYERLDAARSSHDGAMLVRTTLDNFHIRHAHHLAEMIALLGPPPKEMLQSSGYATDFFNSQGTWKEAVPISSTTLEDLEGNLQDAQQELFLTFLRKMLCWRPEDRKSARDLLLDPWLRSNWEDPAG